MTVFRRFAAWPGVIAPAILGPILALYPEISTAQVEVPPIRYGTRPTLQPNRVGSFAARPFEYGRIARFSTRTGCNDCGIPPGNYDREIPTAGATAISFYPPITEIASQRPAPVVTASTSVSPAATITTAGIASPAIVNTAPSDSSFLQPDDSIVSKHFRLQTRRLLSGSFVLENPAVYVNRDGLALASGKIYQLGGPTGTDRGGRVRIEVRGYASALAMGSANFSQSRLPDDAVVLWSYSTEVWVPRGGPTNATVLNSSVDDVGIPGIQSTFARLTHVEVMITPRTVR